MKCKCCGNERFIGHQVIRAGVEVDGSGTFVGNLFGGLEAHIYDSGNPYGPFTFFAAGKLPLEVMTVCRAVSIVYIILEGLVQEKFSVFKRMLYH